MENIYQLVLSWPVSDATTGHCWHRTSFTRQKYTQHWCNNCVVVTTTMGVFSSLVVSDDRAFWKVVWSIHRYSLILPTLSGSSETKNPRSRVSLACARSRFHDSGKRYPEKKKKRYLENQRLKFHKRKKIFVGTTKDIKDIHPPPSHPPQIFLVWTVKDATKIKYFIDAKLWWNSALYLAVRT